MFENFRHVLVVVLDPAAVVVWIVRVSGLTLLDVAKVMPAVQRAAMAEYGVEMVEVPAMVLDLGFLRKLIAIRPFQDFIEIQSLAEITATIDLAHTAVPPKAESIDVHLENRWWLLHPHELLCILFAVLIVVVLVFSD